MMSNVKMDQDATDEDKEARSRRELSFANSCVATLLHFEEWGSLAFFVQGFFNVSLNYCNSEKSRSCCSTWRLQDFRGNFEQNYESCKG